MGQEQLFNFDSDTSELEIPPELNNPFGIHIPEIARIAAREFQAFIHTESANWNYDFQRQKGKMFGVLVVQLPDSSLRYLGTVSGKLPANAHCSRFTPSIFDDSTDDYFINKGMTELTELSNQIKQSQKKAEVSALQEKRKLKSIALQQRLFENYKIMNRSGEKKNVLEIFRDSSHGNPPSAAGECAAPKLLHFAFSQNLKPIAIAEFWWGGPIKNLERKDKVFYPACVDRCRPILEFILGDYSLYQMGDD